MRDPGHLDQCSLVRDNYRMEGNKLCLINGKDSVFYPPLVAVVGQFRVFREWRRSGNRQYVCEYIWDTLTSKLWRSNHFTYHGLYKHLVVKAGEAGVEKTAWVIEWESDIYALNKCVCSEVIQNEEQVRALIEQHKAEFPKQRLIRFYIGVYDPERDGYYNPEDKEPAAM